MNFSEMLIGLGNGKSYRRKDWTSQDGYLSIPMGTKHIYKTVVVNGGLNMSLALFSLDDFSATDWQEATLTDVTAPMPTVPPATIPASETPANPT